MLPRAHRGRTGGAPDARGVRGLLSAGASHVRGVGVSRRDSNVITWNTRDIHLRSTSMVFSRSVGEVRWEMGA